MRMPLSEKKMTPAPFKTMDIKTALLAGNNRKRKASSQIQNDSKNLKLSNETNDSDCEIVLCEKSTTNLNLESFSDVKELGDCKENTDLNVITDEPTSLGSSGNSVCENNILSFNESKLSDSECPKEQQTGEQNTSVESTQEELSTDELNSSVNTSANATLDASGLSMAEDLNAEDVCSKEQVSNNSKAASAGEKQKVKLTTESKVENEKVKKRKRMTPEEAKKRSEEREKKQNERTLKKQELEEKRKARLLEKEQKIKERQLRKEQEEQEKKEKERMKQEKKEQEEKERLQKIKEKEEKNRMKLEEKKKKEEFKLKQEEEKRKAEEEKKKAKLEKELKEKEKKERAKAAFAKFFVKEDISLSATSVQAIEKDGVFLPFQVSDDMILAPVVPTVARERFNKKELDHFLHHQGGKELYLQVLKSGNYKAVKLPKKDEKLGSSEADIILIDKNAQAEFGLTAKLLQFSENVRPPYWGTWRKRSKVVKPCNPFGQDEMFDYSVDSDEEWDEGGPGESLSGTEPEDESEDDYEVDNEFFVPHGYLSAEEEKEEDEETTNDPEKQKALLKLKLQEFEMERKKKTTELKPIILGCFFENDVKFQDGGLLKFLQNFTADIISETPILTCFTVKAKIDVSNSNSPSTSLSGGNSVKKEKKLYVPERAMPLLIRLLHGNTNKRSTLIVEFQKFWSLQTDKCSEENVNPTSSTTVPENAVSNADLSVEPSADSVQISKRQLNLTMKKICVYGKCPDSSFKKLCWWVHDEIREKYGLSDISIPNQWNYVSKNDSEELINTPKPVGASIKEFLAQ